ncbi:hypothetical protein PRIPAC_87656 [Pristionchus pacificus]|uniref:Uncharacterized protein n=1 Tax=Pristionchus pacificus TaxID=54126 RepID=A0A2A6B8S8_PRIPA|nr:hypothetical protein PRIPAC_87656 [Pristionchus pacificus]|eukprot:PDM62267.1 hypothetical protein PRIPAC_51709 [Pristionchus pacificus]
MKTLLLLAVLPLVLEATRAKRFAALASSIGGSAGCVVTGNKLYANGFPLRDLTAAEQAELTTYETAVGDYKKKVKAAVESHRETIKKQMMSMMQSGGQEGAQNNQLANQDGDENIEAPARPSFCTEATTTQYYFDGCMVQNNKVYVGKTFARDLTGDEISQLQAFDTKMTAYQKQVQDQIHKQVKGMFGGNDFFASLFGGKVQDDTETTTQAVAAPSTSTEKPLEAPESPKFCVSI